jgi:hypothetical protein
MGSIVMRRDQVASNKLGIAIGVVIAVASTVALWPRVVSPTEAARRGLEALFTGNTESIIEFVDPKELDATGLNRAQVSRIVKDYITPRFSRLKRYGSVVTKESKATGAADAIVDTVLPDGTRSPYIVSADLTPSGPRFDAWLTQAVLTATLVDQNRGNERDKRKHLLVCLEKALPELRRFGMKGLVTSGRGVNFADFISDLKRRIESRPVR